MLIQIYFSHCVEFNLALEATLLRCIRTWPSSKERAMTYRSVTRQKKFHNEKCSGHIYIYRIHCWLYLI